MAEALGDTANWASAVTAQAAITPAQRFTRAQDLRRVIAAHGSQSAADPTSGHAKFTPCGRVHVSARGGLFSAVLPPSSLTWVACVGYLRRSMIWPATAITSQGAIQVTGPMTR